MVLSSMLFGIAAGPTLPAHHDSVRRLGRDLSPNERAILRVLLLLVDGQTISALLHERPDRGMNLPHIPKAG